MHPATIEAVKCCWCGDCAQGTGAALTADGWRSLPLLGRTFFYCPVCYFADDIEPLVIQGATGMRVADLLERLGGRREHAPQVLAVLRRAA